LKCICHQYFLNGKNHRQAIVSLVERRPAFSLIGEGERKTAQAVTDAMIKLLKPRRALVHTITPDNGREFAEVADNIIISDMQSFCNPTNSFLTDVFQHYLP